MNKKGFNSEVFYTVATSIVAAISAVVISWNIDSSADNTRINAVEIQRANETYKYVEDIDVYETGCVYWSLEDELAADELEYLALCVAAEAQGQPVEGLRLVTDTILNRVDSDLFPDTITEVINQEGQFSVVADGRINTVNPTDQVFEIVSQELAQRTNDEVLYFNAIGFREGTPMCKVEDHYFSAE